MRTVFSKEDCQNLKVALGKEWLETNGLGGFACSSIIGANVRRQSGWLIAALKPPVERYVLLSKIEDRVTSRGEDFHLSTNLYPGTVYPHGFNIQTEFRLRPWPTFRYVGPDFAVERSVCLVHGENTVVIGYHNTDSREPIELKLRPLLAFRDYNSLGRRDDTVDMTVERGDGVLSVQPRANLPRLYFYAPALEAEIQSDWYNQFVYPVEQERGLDSQEDLFTPFELTFRLEKGASVQLVISTESKSGVDGAALLEKERQRRLGYEAEKDSDRRALLIAADSFVARRGESCPTVLAGYPWFTDWGRDTMVSLPGLTMTRGQLETAGKILLALAQYCDKGMIPNVFPQKGETPEYNTVDASLWFVVAAWKFWKAGGDEATLKKLLPALSDVAEYYRNGTRYDIHVDGDGLLTAGTPGTQLTWMDVKVDGYVPTPRHGKPVEVNALWINALIMLAALKEKLLNDIQAAVILRKQADVAAASFLKAFWNTEGNFLYDVIQGDFRDPAIRPNQIFAVSLPFSPLDKERQTAVLECVTKNLLTPYGLRSLAPGDARYCGHYTGNARQRDCAYHQGTVWGWLIGPYCDAYVKVNGNGKPPRKAVAALLQPLLKHLEEAGLGSISEIFEGDAPHRPVGCFAQAWSVAELLRAYDAYGRG